ncbi:MAG: carboxypeptidase-like regulatory domain-containing protein [Acidobacteriota bacterium]
MTRFTFYAIVVCVVVGASAVSTQVSKAFTPFSPILASANTGNEASGQRSASSNSQSDAAKRRAGSITGRLVDESGQPIPNAGVYVRKAGPVSGPSRSLGTDEDGRFRADDLAAGAYSVSAYVPGYVPATEAVEREYYRAGEVVNLRMMKGGIITGTVTNSSGEPVVGVRVSLVRVRDGESRPIRGVGQSGGGRQTDDRGVYRIYGLAPGTYLVVAGGGGQMGFSSSGYDSDVPTYYPSTTRDAAAEVVVRAGQETTGIDIRYRGDRGYIVSGTLSGSLGSDSGMRGVLLMLSHTASSALESRTFVQPRVGRGFALYGVPDGDYELVAQMDIGTESSAASTPRHVVVKGSDVTGIELSLVPLGSISGRAVLENIPEVERASECKSKRITSLDELVLTARRDEKPGAKDPPGVGVFAANEGSPDEKGEFKILSLAAARYRIEMRLPGEDWFVRSLTRAGPPVSNQNDVAAAGLGLNTGQHITDLTVTLAEGAAALRGKVIPASEGSRLPAQLRVHLVPAEPESTDDVIRFFEARLDSEGAFSLTNLAPGRYYLHVRPVSDDQLMERNPQPLVWMATARAKLRRDALAANVLIELQRCQRVTEYVLKYTSAPARKAESKKTP